MLSDDKVRNEHDSRLTIDRQCGEVCDQRRKLEELKFLGQEKTKIGNELSDEVHRAKQLLCEKTIEAQKIRDEGTARGVDCDRQRGHLSTIQHEIEVVKAQRVENHRTILHLNEVNDSKSHEANQQAEKLKQLGAEIARVNVRIEDL